MIAMPKKNAKVIVQLRPHSDDLEECSLFNCNYELDTLNSSVEDDYALFNTEYEDEQEIASNNDFLLEKKES